MCTTTKFSKNSNLIENLEIKEEPKEYDTITFEDYKITENSTIANIKEEPVDYFEVVENFQIEHFDENSMEIIKEKIDLNVIKIEEQNEKGGESWIKSSIKLLRNLEDVEKCDDKVHDNSSKSSPQCFQNSPQDIKSSPKFLKNSPQDLRSLAEGFRKSPAVFGNSSTFNNSSQATQKNFVNSQKVFENLPKTLKSSQNHLKFSLAKNKNSPQTHQNYSKYKPIISKLITENSKFSSTFDEKFGFKNEPEEHFVVNFQIFSPEQYKILINHDHNYSERRNISQFYQPCGEYNRSNDENDENGENSNGIYTNDHDSGNTYDDYVSNDSNNDDYDNNCYIVEKLSKSFRTPPNFNKLAKLNTRKISSSSLESSDESESLSSSSESEDSLDEDEGGIQYKEVSIEEMVHFSTKTRKFCENSEDDHSCYTKSFQRSFEKNQKMDQNARKSQQLNFYMKNCDTKFREPKILSNSPRKYVNSTKFEFAPKMFKLTTKFPEPTTNQTKAQKLTTCPSNLPKNSPLKCPDCPLTFNDTLRFNRHKRLHVLPQHQCRNCLKKFKRKSMLKKHFCDIKCQRCVGTCTCRMETSNDCIICQKINFRYFLDYKQHMVSQHHEIVTCKICEKNNFTFFKHKQHGHEVQKFFRCIECTSVLKSRDQLHYHMEIHAKNFSCKKCDKIFTRRYLLKQHELTHENLKHFNCKICDKNFKRKFCLENHKKVIHGDKEKEEKYLKLQREIHAGKSIGWISCSKCPALFRNKQSHQKHVGQAHVGSNKIVVKRGEK